MTGYKLDNLTVLTENNAIGKVVTAGFWESDVIAALLAGEPQKLIMFEPDNALYAAASAQYADESNVEVRNATLSDKTGEADYFVFTPNRFSSLFKPKQLLKIYRKNSNDNVISINVSTVQSVCEQEKILPSAGNILLLGVNCPSTILSDAVQTDHLSYFDVIVVRQPKQGLYETEQQQQETLSSVLQESQFTCAQEIAGDVMYTQFVYVRDHQREKINTLQAKVTQAETQNATIAKQLTEAESRSSQFESSATELNTHYSKLKVQCEELTENVSALEIKGTELATQNTQLDNALIQAKAQGEKLSTDRAQKLTENEQLAAQITALHTKQNELAESLKNKDIQVEKVNAEVVKLKNDLEISSKDKVQLLANSERLNNDLLDTRQKLENELTQGTLKKQQLVTLAGHVRELESERVSLIEKQQAIDLEMAKVEAQIELIKDVVIREKAF